MADKKLRTPIIKPRTQSGTFYTFGSAMEDIGLNVNENFNRVEMSHYALLDIPKFCRSLTEVPTDDKDNTLVLGTTLGYEDKSKYPNMGDYMFAESFQDYCLNMETVLRNNPNYNYAANETVSERVFWKWLFKHYPGATFVPANTVAGSYWKEGKSSIVKAFGSISAGSQRTDDSGIYNETFVQIPSSYGQMPVIFKKVTDENYIIDKDYNATTPPNIENISDSEISGGVIASTGISPVAKYDSDTKYTVSSSIDYDSLQVVIDIDELRKAYGSSTLTYDEIAKDRSTDLPTEYSFNAILVYYSLYNSDKTKRLATNAYGIYILDNSINYNDSDHLFYFPSLTKKKGFNNESASGTSYSFRINVKPTTAYSGDIHVSDNSTECYAMTEDFNDVVRNLSAALNTLTSNSKTLLKIVQTNNEIKQMASDAIEKVDDVESDVIALKNVNFPYTNDNIVENGTTLSKSMANSILGCLNVVYSSDGKLSMTIDRSSLQDGTSEKTIANKMTRVIDGYSYVDALSVLMLLSAAAKS